jgi:hypothetical protein
MLYADVFESGDDLKGPGSEKLFLCFLTYQLLTVSYLK